MYKLALIQNPIDPGNPTNPVTAVNVFANIIQNLISLGLTLGAVIFVFMFIIGGINWITSGGDKNKLESARGTVMNAVTGLAILFLLFVVLNLIGTFFNIDLLHLDLSKIKIKL